MSINLGPNLLNTSFLKPLNFSHYFTIRRKMGYTVWLNGCYHTLLPFANKFCQAFTNKAKIYLVYCLYEAYGTYWGKITAEQQNERQMYRKLCQEKKICETSFVFCFSKGDINKRKKNLPVLKKNLEILKLWNWNFHKTLLGCQEFAFFYSQWKLVQT